MTDPKSIATKILSLMPSSLEPGDRSVDFGEVASRIRSLDRQFFFLSLDEWLEENESRLTGAKLELRTDDLTLYWDDRDLRIGGKPPKDEQLHAVEELVVILEDGMWPENMELIKDLLPLFNSGIRPIETHDGLCTVAAHHRVVEDPENWLMRHRTARQADRLSADTPKALPPTPRPRI